MADKRSRKYHNLKESKRTILSKKDDFTASSHSDAPKILLKPPKEKPVVAASVPPPISIATRERMPSPTPAIATVKELIAPVIIEQPVAQIPLMTKPISLVNEHFLLSTSPFDYLVDSNANFFVVGVIGAQGTGKSTLMNLLCPTDTTGRQLQFFRNQDAAFTTKRTKEQLFSTAPTTDGINMYITKDRTILLDCAPVLCNPYKKDYVLNEIDDLKMVIFMMSVCHLLIVVQEDMMQNSMLRLLHCAELMKPSLDKEATTISSGQQNEEYLPNVLFVKNMANTRDFQSSNVERINRMYKFFFSRSKLRMYAGNHRPADDIEEADADGSRRPAIQRNINFIVFPMIPNDSESPPTFTGYPEIHLLIAQYRQQVFGTPRNPFQALPPLTQFLESSWSHLVVNAWESLKNNYFLRKYENFKEWTNRTSVQ